MPLKDVRPSQEAMEAAFDVVSNVADWRDPINITLTVARMDEIGGYGTIYEAIQHFTGDKEDTLDPNNTATITAKGYRAGPCGP